MAGSVCKYILNNGVAALMQSLEKALTSPLVRNVMLPAQDCNDLIQALADFDVRTYTGIDPRRRSGCAAKCAGLRDVLGVLKERGVVTDEVFEVFQGAE